MLAGVAVQFHQQVGCAIAHQCLLLEGRVAVHHHQEFDHPLHLVQVADNAFGGGKAVHRALTRSGGALFHADLATQLARVDHGAIGEAGQVAGHED